MHCQQIIMSGGAGLVIDVMEGRAFGQGRVGDLPQLVEGGRVVRGKSQELASVGEGRQWCKEGRAGSLALLVKGGSGVKVRQPGFCLSYLKELCCSW